MEKSWNFEIRTKSHGKVKKFDRYVQHFINWHCYAATYLSPSCLFFGYGILSFGHGKVIEKSWILLWKFRGNPELGMSLYLSV